ncbi:MAG: EAL domain-containing protein [Hyphomicrobiales bacterium]|nr:EAL domain-containing protein [Hyphomicrobiales bacterium]
MATSTKNAKKRPTTASSKRLLLSVIITDGAIAVAGIILIGVLWAFTSSQINSENLEIKINAKQQASKLTHRVKQKLHDMIKNIDQSLSIIQYLHHHQINFTDGDIISISSLKNSYDVQLAMINKYGILTTSTTAQTPTKIIDLSDRAHFKFQKLNYRLNELYISVPIFGRVSKQWVIQFTKPLFDANNNFDGVAVVSVNTNVFEKMHSNLEIPKDASLIVFGSLDKVVRGGYGDIAARTGSTIDDSNEYQNDNILQTKKSMNKWPLTILTAINLTDRQHAADAKHAQYNMLSIMATLLLLAGMLAIIKSRRHVDAKMIESAHVDSLTGLPNRKAFLKELEHRCGNGADGRDVVLHIIDLDRFKEINDSFGHPTGDAILKEVSSRLKTSLRDDEFAARLGGDEFVVLHYAYRHGEAVAFASRLCLELARPIKNGSLDLAVGGTVGVACFPSDADTSSELLARADLALYDAKSSARGSYSFFKPALFEKMKLRRDIIDGLPRAVGRGEFELYFQPIVDFTDMKITKFEALIRWNHSVRGIISPMEFIPIAEESNLITEIGNWVIRTACEHLANCPANVSIAVNCSAKQFQVEGFSKYVIETMEEYGIKPQQLIVEITESLLVMSDRWTIKNFSQFVNHGILLSIDDFGTGFSALRYLAKHEVNIIKIDRSFVREIKSEADANVSIIKMIINLAKSLNMKVVAEGIETLTQLELVRGLGCDYGQGYYFGKPAAALRSLVRANTYVNDRVDGTRAQNSAKEPLGSPIKGLA